MWMLEGKTSLLDCDALTWSLGCTGLPSRSVASVASTSLMFMFDEVPEPVWNTSTGKSPSQRPSTTSAAAERIASAISDGTTPSSALTFAAAALIWASAAMWARSRPCPLIGKFSTARWVCARYFAAKGTWTSPMLSCSVRHCGVSDCISSGMPAILSRAPERRATGL